jgi:hypothetical protein
MSNFFLRGLSFIVLGALLVVILPALAQLFFSLGPFGFVVALFVFFAAGYYLAR